MSANKVTVKAMTQIKVDTLQTFDMYELLKKEKLIYQEVEKPNYSI
jgi:hypothetical protein